MNNKPNENIELDILFDNIFQNKIYLDIPTSENEQSSYNSKLNHTKINNDIDNIFSDMKMKKYIDNNVLENIKNNHNIINNNIDENNDKINSLINKIKKDTIEDKYNKIIKNSNKYLTKQKNILDKKYKCNFLDEICKLMFIDINTFKTKIIEFINNENNLDYIKSLTKFHKKFKINVSNIIVKKNINLDITENKDFIKLISKVFNINLVIFKNGLYEIYSNQDNPSEYNIFNKYKIEFEKNDEIIVKYYYKYETDLTFDQWTDFKKFNIYPFYKLSNINSNINQNIKNYFDVKKIVKLKLNELKDLCSINNINSNDKKTNLQTNLLYIYNEFN
jgi:hypothetical protein